MKDVIGIVVALLIIAVLLYALVKQWNYTKSIDNRMVNAVVKKQLKRKHRVMTISLAAVLVCYTVNIVGGVAMGLASNVTAIGTFVSFFMYIYAKFAMAPKQASVNY